MSAVASDNYWEGGSMWGGHYVTSGQDYCIRLALVMLGLMGTCFMCFLSDCYRMLPFWAPIRKFDSDCSEDMLARQAAMYQHILDAEERAHEKQLHGDMSYGYGAIGRPTWGVLEAPHECMPVNIPGAPGATMRINFDETQHMRAKSRWWGRDEPYFIAKQGNGAPPLMINEPGVCATRAMV
eukprot:TRINITY_DN30192_c0_g1_i1.p1 TRINITY_DN30192_c0_g1~~TRINITY_DN30192_c0_g1_i1.p1  ORF type:complete len:182 (-),score=40.04 TRINITY_DN30192_c0_g1_i1:103-648(-)